MSRHGYVDDLDANVMNLYRGSVTRAMRGKRGQRFLRELAAALDAMPIKELIYGELVDEAGSVCTIGAVCQSRGLDVSKIDYEEPEEVGKAVGIASCMAAEIEFMNDDWSYSETPQKRWSRMRKWVEEQLTADSTCN
jgi:hypothetical protein